MHGHVGMVRTDIPSANIINVPKHPEQLSIHAYIYSYLSLVCFDDHLTTGGIELGFDTHFFFPFFFPSHSILNGATYPLVNSSHTHIYLAQAAALSTEHSADSALLRFAAGPSSRTSSFIATRTSNPLSMSAPPASTPWLDNDPSAGGVGIAPVVGGACGSSSHRSYRTKGRHPPRRKGLRRFKSCKLSRVVQRYPRGHSSVSDNFLAARTIFTKNVSFGLW